MHQPILLHAVWTDHEISMKFLCFVGLISVRHRHNKFVVIVLQLILLFTLRFCSHNFIWLFDTLNHWQLDRKNNTEKNLCVYMGPTIFDLTSSDRIVWNGTIFDCGTETIFLSIIPFNIRGFISTRTHFMVQRFLASEFASFLCVYRCIPYIHCFVFFLLVVDWKLYVCCCHNCLIAMFTLFFVHTYFNSSIRILFHSDFCCCWFFYSHFVYLFVRILFRGKKKVFVVCKFCVCGCLECKEIK